MLMLQIFNSLLMFWGINYALLKTPLRNFSIMMALEKDVLICLPKRKSWRKLQLWSFKMERIHQMLSICTTYSECGWVFFWVMCITYLQVTPQITSTLIRSICCSTYLLGSRLTFLQFSSSICGSWSRRP